MISKEYGTNLQRWKRRGQKHFRFSEVDSLAVIENHLFSLLRPALKFWIFTAWYPFIKDWVLFLLLQLMFMCCFSVVIVFSQNIQVCFLQQLMARLYTAYKKIAPVLETSIGGMAGYGFHFSEPSALMRVGWPVPFPRPPFPSTLKSTHVITPFVRVLSLLEKPTRSGFEPRIVRLRGECRNHSAIATLTHLILCINPQSKLYTNNKLTNDSCCFPLIMISLYLLIIHQNVFVWTQ